MRYSFYGGNKMFFFFLINNVISLKSPGDATLVHMKYTKVFLKRGNKRARN
jgi:hypothetical protein